MKKIIAIVLAAIMVFSLAACGAKEAVEDSINEIKDAVEDVKEGNIEQDDAQEQAAAPAEEATTGMANPWVETDAEGVMDKTGFDFVIPKGATDVKYSVLESSGLAQMTFTLDGVEYTTRMMDIPGTEMQDISGMYYQWEKEESFDLATGGKKMYAKDADGNNVYCAIWYDVVPGVAYSLSCVTDKTVDIQKLAEEIYVPLQGDSYGDDEIAAQEANENKDVEGLVSISESYPELYLEGTYHEDTIDQDEKDFGMVASYYTDNELLPDYDIWRFGKDGYSLEDFTQFDAVTYGADTYSILGLYGVPAGYYVTAEKYDDTTYITQTKTLEEDNDFVQVVSWLKCDEIELADSGLFVYAPKGFSRFEESTKQGNYVVYSYKNDSVEGVADFRISSIAKKDYNLVSLMKIYAKAYDAEDYGVKLIDDEVIAWISGVKVNDGSNNYDAVIYFVDNGDSFLQVDFYSAEGGYVLDSAPAIMNTLHCA